MKGGLAIQKERSLPQGHRFFSDCQRENWARFIQWSFKKADSAWFATMTFKDYIKINLARKTLKQWLYDLSEAHRRFFALSTGCYQLRWITATEWQIRMVVHYHVLIMGNGIDSLSRKRWENRWESLNRNTGFCRIYDADYKIAPYLAKYVAKNYQFGDTRQQGDLWIGGAWRGYRVPASVSCVHANSVKIGRVLTETSDAG